MIDILADTTTGIAVAGTGITVTTVIGIIIKRQINKVLEHVDDGQKHVDPNNGYVHQSMCNERIKNFSDKLEDNTKNVAVVHKRIDTLVDVQNKNTNQILMEIKKVK